VDEINGMIRVPRIRTKVPSSIPITAACREALRVAREQSIGSPFVFVTDEVVVAEDGIARRFPYC
jgi:hypothetical protein